MVQHNACALPSALHGKVITRNPATSRRSTAWALAAYAVIFALALGFDFLTDQSFGAVMLAVLPISLVALICLLAGAFMKGAHKIDALFCWFVGATLILIVSMKFCSLGADQAKTGELIFTHAAMIMALPSSVVLPFVATWLEPLVGGNIMIRLGGAWLVCIGAGWLQWGAFGWMRSGMKERR